MIAYEADGTETSYYYGAEGLSGQYNDGTKESLYYHYDNIGSTTLLTDAAGKVIERFVYGTYGELLSEVTKKVRFLYNGAYGVTTDDNGLYYMRARYYNPDIKRFINQDIKVGDIGSSQSLNRYAYCEGNPVSLIDPFGLSPQEAQEQGEKSKYEKLHKALDLLGLVWDGADVINAFVYAAEGQWGKAAVSVACALPFIGTVVTAATKAKKFAKVGSMIGKTLQMAGKVYMTAQAAATALDMAGNARLEYAVNGGQVTLGVAANTLGAIAVGAIAAMSGKDLVSETLNLSKLDAQDISFKSSGQETADTISGKNTEGSGVSGSATSTKRLNESGRVVEGANDSDRYVYRALNSKDYDRYMNGLGLEAKNPNGKWGLEEHILSGSGKKSWTNDPFISTTLDIDVAREFNSAGSGYGIVKIDLNKVDSPIYKGYEIFPRTNSADSLAYHYSVWQQEISVFQYIPREAIVDFFN